MSSLTSTGWALEKLSPGVAELVGGQQQGPRCHAPRDQGTSVPSAASHPGERTWEFFLPCDLPIAQ